LEADYEKKKAEEGDKSKRIGEIRIERFRINEGDVNVEA
jgi:hypothetical protein